MDKSVVPRAEFRVFGQGVIDIVRQKMWSAGATLHEARVMPKETYFISRHTDAVNVKLRAGQLDIKLKVDETPEGYEVFQPAGKYPLPLKQADLAALLAHLQVRAAMDRSEYTVENLLAIARAHPDLRPISVEKTRYGFVVNGAICEYAEVFFNGARIETACCESEHTAEVTAAITALGIAAMPNTSYLKVARQILSLS